MRIFIKLLAISLLLSACSGAYNSKSKRGSTYTPEHQATKSISDHVTDVGAKVATDAATIPTDISPYVTP